MKLVVDPSGSAVDLAKAPLFVEDISAQPAKKRIDLVSSAGVDGARPFGKAAVDVLLYTVKVRVDEQSTLDEALAVLREVSQLIDEAEKRLPAGLPLAETPDGSSVASTVSILIGELTELPREGSGENLGWYHRSPVAVLTLTCDPFYRGPVEEAGDEEGEDPLLELSLEDVKGDVDAELLAVVSDKAGVSHSYHELGIESRHYNPAEPAPLEITGDELVVEGFQGEAIEATEGARSSKVVKASLGSQGVAICGTGDQPHIGLWRESLRFRASSTDVYVRLGWRVGDGPWGYGEGGGWIRAPLADAWFEQFLNAINVPEADVGGQRWEGRIEAYSTAAGDTVEVDYLENMPAERWQKVRSPLSLDPPGLLLIGDDFNQTEGNATGKEAAVGGVYAALTGSDSTDFTISEGRLKRSAVSDSGSMGGFKGRALGTPVEAEDLVLRTSFEIETSSALEALRFGHVLSYDGEAFVLVRFIYFSIADVWAITVLKNTGAPLTSNIVVENLATVSPVVGTLLTHVLGETLTIYVAGPGEELKRLVQVEDAMIGAEGKSFIFDEHTGAAAANRYYDSHAGWEPVRPFVCAANQDLRIEHSGSRRYDESGTYLARVAEQRGGQILLPPAAAGDRSARLVSKLRSTDIEDEASSLADTKHKLTATYTPRYRFPRDS